ncbi:histone deacetylase [Thermanaerothrix sp. 4228-RoL]|uniref:Histone deacetylase n=1 Tax=Thermanaerothrix solaris TaxID=3058434 RepID=A0ABU3NQB0_9CHLR|nr:histone deacetylase [Thermanaerothrix sp. 4228-RoL]MDT8899017.1 histone deacetylase [Thermanaerothrix sp. 4228-RoL]
MHIFYSDHCEFPLPPGHRFPAEKYRLLREALLQQDIIPPARFHPAEPIPLDLLALAHTPAYIQAVLEGTLPSQIERQIGLPWSPELAQRSLLSVGGTWQAAQHALRDGLSGNLAGGTHHALADQGMGFCVFNDAAVTAIALLEHGWVHRIAVVDLDVHQGNGTAAILGPYSQIFTLSLHGEKNYPFRKVPSTLDIGLPDHCDDATYLAALDEGIKAVLNFRPQIVLYLAGADPLAADRLGRLDLTLEGLAQRDRMVLDACSAHNIPVVLVMAGGYAQPIELTVEAHLQTYVLAQNIVGMA